MADTSFGFLIFLTIVVWISDTSEALYIIRLVPRNTSVPRLGRLDIKIGATWYHMCGEHMSDTQANVGCKQLGYEGGVAVQSGTSRPVSLSKWSKYFICSTTDTSYDDCLQWSTNQCNYDAYVLCYNTGQVYVKTLTSTMHRSLNYQGPFMGYPLIWLKHEVGILDRGWSNSEAQVVCRELGYDGGAATWMSTLGYPGNTQTNCKVTCAGDENSLVRCCLSLIELGAGSFADPTTHSAGIVCNPLDGLTNQILQYGQYGAVLVKYHGVWGMVCDTDWRDIDATVYCKDKGYLGGEAIGYGAMYYYSLPITWAWNTNCTGAEPSFFDCTSDGWAMGPCDEKTYSVGAVCHNEPSTDYTVIMTGYGSGPGNDYMGIKYRGVEGTAADENWTKEDATVACREMGHQVGYPIYGKFVDGYYGAPRTPVWTSNITCSGDELRLQDCIMPGFGNVNERHGYDVSVICANHSDPTQNMELRLGGRSPGPNYGALEVKLGEYWGGVCEQIAWTQTEVDVVCRQLGYRTGIVNFKFDGARKNGTAFIMRNVRCHGNESVLWDCSFDGWGGWSTCSQNTQHVGVLCFNDGMDFRLTGATRMDGRAEIMVDGVNGYLCRDLSYLINSAARTYCRSLGYSSGSHIDWLDDGKGPAMSWITTVRCYTGSKSLLECSHSGWGQPTTSPCPAPGYFVCHGDVASPGGKKYGMIVNPTIGTNRYFSGKIEWTVEVEPVYELNFHLVYIDIVSSAECKQDYLAVYKGLTSPLPEQKLCGRLTAVSFTVKSEKAKVVFLAVEPENVGTGFALYYEAVCVVNFYWENSTLGTDMVTRNAMSVGVMELSVCQEHCLNHYLCDHLVYDVINQNCTLMLTGFYTTQEILLLNQTSLRQVPSCKPNDTVRTTEPPKTTTVIETTTEEPTTTIENTVMETTTGALVTIGPAPTIDIEYGEEDVEYEPNEPVEAEHAVTIGCVGLVSLSIFMATIFAMDLTHLLHDARQLKANFKYMIKMLKSDDKDPNER